MRTDPQPFKKTWRRAVMPLVAAVLPLAVTLTTLAPADAASAHRKPGHRSLAAVLTADGNRFDHNPNDFDITTEAVLAVLAAKPDSPVKVLTQGNVPLTAFVPTDRAFRRLVHSLTGKSFRKESKVFAAVASLGIDTVEAVLLYHVVPGATITKRAARHSDGAKLATALGKNVKVDVTRRGVRLLDQDLNAPNPRIVRFDINKGNVQIAHAINRVLRPADL